MGKSNRIKANKASKSAVSLGGYKKTTGMPNWAINLIAIVITLAILLGGVALALSANGTIMRMRTALRTENFRVDGKMMTYFVNAKYQNFLSTYNSYLSNLSLDTTKPLDKQTVGDTSVKESVLDSAVCGDFQGTWLEWFVSETEAEVKDLLVYCEIAHELGIELGEAEKNTIDATIASLEQTATDYGYPLNAYLAASFGEGVKEKDVRHAMELSELATLAQLKLSDKLMGEIADTRVQETYEQDSTKYNRIDYSFYSFRVDYADISEDMKEANANVTDEEILNEYKKQIAEAKEKAEALYATDSIDAFEKALLTEVANETYETEFETKTLPTEGRPSDENLALIKKGVIEQAVKEVMNKATAESAVKKDGEKYVGYTVEMSKEWADVINAIKSDVHSMVSSNRETYVQDGAAYKDSDNFSTWAFDGARKVGDTHKILNGDGSDETAEIKRDSGYFRVEVYRLRATQYKDATKTQDLSCMIFATEDEAKAAIEALKAAGTLDQATFDRIADEKGAAMTDILENYIEGDMGSVDFDAWVFADGRAVGDYTAEPLKLSDSSYAVVYYAAEGDELWFANVKDALLNEDFTAYFTNAQTNTEVKVKANVLKKIKIGD